jgi:hypothetical protein
MDALNLQIVARDNSGILQDAATVTTVDKTLFGSSGTFVGLNVYQIIPKVKQYVMGGVCSTQNGVCSVEGSQISISRYDWGISTPKSFSILSTDLINSNPNTLYYDAVDSNGNENTYSVVTLPSGTNLTELGSFASINNVRLPAGLGTGRINIIYGGNIASMTYDTYYNPVITCPNNAIMFVSSITVNRISNNASVIFLYKYDAITGARKLVFRSRVYDPVGHFESGSDGSIGGYMYPGESILMASGTVTGTGTPNIIAYANVVIKYLC